jgi:hypothetical protein
MRRFARNAALTPVRRHDERVSTASSQRTLRRLNTPRAAGLAGVLFAVLFGTAITLIHTALPDGAAPGTQWLDGSATRLRVAAILMPFAGICFLWFIGVVRDGLGRFEDKFFASVFLGSGLLFLGMIFAASAVGVALVAARSSGIDEVGAFGQALLLTLSKTYALRMAGVFMISLATIWLKTGLVARWLVILTYVLALTLLFASDVSMWMTLTFPVWVLIVSLMALNRAGVIDLRREEP